MSNVNPHTIIITFTFPYYYIHKLPYLLIPNDHTQIISSGENDEPINAEQRIRLVADNPQLAAEHFKIKDAILFLNIGLVTY